MLSGHVSRELANLGFEAFLTLAGFLCFCLFKRFYPKNHDDDDTYDLVDKDGRKTTVTMKSECSPDREVPPEVEK